jgi:ArsR family metal-binding transcriptional regulator
MCVQSAKKAIDTVHSDTSVSLEQTKDSLEELQEHLDILIEAVNEDIRMTER